jgi:hypothetical protein
MTTSDRDFRFSRIEGIVVLAASLLLFLPWISKSFDLNGVFEAVALDAGQLASANHMLYRPMGWIIKMILQGRSWRTGTGVASFPLSRVLLLGYLAYIPFNTWWDPTETKWFVVPNVFLAIMVGRALAAKPMRLPARVIVSLVVSGVRIPASRWRHASRDAVATGGLELVTLHLLFLQANGHQLYFAESLFRRAGYAPECAPDDCRSTGEGREGLP